MSTLTANLNDKDGNVVYPATDWSVLNSIPDVLQDTDIIKTDDNLLTDTGWTTDGVTLGDNTTAANSLENSAPKYRCITLGGLKWVMLQGTISGGNGTLVTYPTSIGFDSTNVWISLPTNNSTKIIFTGNTIKTADGVTDDIADYTNYYIMYVK